MRLEFLQDLLVGAGLGVAGRDVFVYHMPETVQRGVMIRQQLIGTPVDHELPGYRKTEFQLIARARTHPEIFDLIARAVTTLTFTQVTQLPGRQVNYMRPRHEPIIFPRSDGSSIEASVNFDCSFVVDSL